MKWFKHLSDSHTNGKMRQILRKHGLEGYAFCWICRELVAKEGEKFRLKAEKQWKTTLSEVVKKSVEEVEEYLNYFSEINAICPKSLERGELFIPKMKDYADNYSKYGQRSYKETSKQLSVEENRIEEEKKRRINIYIKHFNKKHKEITDVPYIINYGRDIKLLKELSEFSEKDVLSLIDEFFNSNNEWWSDKLSIGVFKTVIPQLIGRLRKKI